MRRILLVLIAALALAGAAAWFARHSRTARGSRAEARLPVREVEDADTALAVLPTTIPGLEPGAGERPPDPPGTAPPHPSRRQPASLEDAELARAHWVEGRVIFPTGTPADEQVFVTANGRKFADGSHQRVEVAPDGSFRVAFSEKTRSGHLELEARYLYLGGLARWRSKEEGKEVVLEPKLGARITASVRVPAGADPGRVGGQLSLEAQSRESSSQTTRALSDGLEFAFDGLAPGVDDERSYVLSYDGEIFLGRSGELVPEAGKTLELELELRRGLTLAGVVRDEAGAPLPGARLDAVVEAEHGWLPGPWRAGTSAADGSFRLGALASGEVELRAELRDHEPLVRNLGKLEEGRDVAGIELVLSRGGSIAGIVRWPDGTPAEATITLVPQEATQYSSTRFTATSDASGSFSISGLSQAPYLVTALATRTEEIPVKSEIAGKDRTRKERTRWSARIEDVAAGARDLVLTLSAGLELHGRVVDDLGEPVKDFWVLADRVGSVPGLDDRSGKLSRSFRDTDGTFRMEGFAPGEWKVWGYGKEHALSEPVHVTMPGGGPVALVAPREAVVSGRVLDPSGVEVSDALVEAKQPAGDRPRTFLGGGRDDAGRNGSFRVDRLSPGRTVLHASSPEHAPSDPATLELRAGETVSGIVLQLRPGGTILGELRGAGGRPQSGGGVSLEGRSFRRHVQTDADGRFRVKGVPPGEISLSAALPEGIELEEQVTLAEGETVRVLLVPPSELVRLHGHVRAGGEPLAGADLWATRAGVESGSSSAGESDRDGAYELALPGPGRYDVMIHAQGERNLSWRTMVDVPAVAELELDVTIPLGRISGRVTDARGEALEGMLVESEPEQHEGEGHGSAQALTDEEGRYELVVPPGRHAVAAGGKRGWWSQARTRSYAEARAGGLIVGEDAHLRGVDLRLETGGTLEGVVREVDGTAVSRANVWVQAGGEPWFVAFADETGGFRADGLAAGPWLVGASAEDLEIEEPARVDIEAGETSRVELVLERVVTVKVHLVIRKSGAPVGCTLQVLDDKGRRQRVETGQSGEAWIGPLVVGRYTVRGEREGQVAERVVEVTGKGKDGEIEVELLFE